MHGFNSNNGISVEVDGKKANYDYDEATGELKLALESIILIIEI